MLGRSEQRGVHPERRGDDPHELAWRGQGASVELPVDGPGANRWIRPKESAEDHELRIEHVDRAGQPEAEPAPDVVEGGQR